MTVRIRKVAIQNFRGIRHFEWCPSDGINCLIGPGDTGKSSILDAVDYCLGARRTIQFTDADFFKLDISNHINIAVTIGNLDQHFKTLEMFGMYLRGFSVKSGLVDDEPEQDLETVLTVMLSVTDDLEPAWTLYSDRAAEQGPLRPLSWNDRVRIAPTRIGAMAEYHLGWQRGSVLNRIAEERADASASLAHAAREARNSFGEVAKGQLERTLETVSVTARELGIPVGDQIKAMLDARSVTFSGGAIALHDEFGVPLKGLGLGSIRLLIAGLQRKSALQSSVILIDELEHGLEPHRIIRLLGSLGAKDQPPPLQVFMTTHSPVTLRELSGDQLFVVRTVDQNHGAYRVGSTTTCRAPFAPSQMRFLLAP